MWLPNYANPEVMVLTDIEKHLSTISFDIKPHIDRSEWAGGSNAKALHEFLITNSIPLVIDADALNILSKTDLGFRCYRRNRY
jgi:NAD(P)H-hydrate repair Nnr-like enzyme with NAD(P)H-hydrate dehydratase domain